MSLDPVAIRENPWPDFDLHSHPRTVRRALLELGSGIEEKTDNTLGFRAVTRRDENGGLVHDCYLVVKSIDFEYPFMVVRQEPGGYPVEIRALSKFSMSAADEPNFIKALGSIFAAPETQKIVASLYDLTV